MRQKKAAYEKALQEKAKVESDNVALKAAYEAAKAAYDEKFEAYQKAKATADTVVATNEATKLAYELAKDQYYTDKKAYDEALAKQTAVTSANESAKLAYELAKAQYDADKKAYDEALAKQTAVITANDAAKVAYETSLAQYEAKLADYLVAKAEFDTRYAQWKNAHDAYTQYIADQNLNDTMMAQSLIFERVPNATHTITGASQYLTKEGVARLNQDIDTVIDRYESNRLTDADLTSTSPYSNQEEEWLAVKVGDQFTVAYENLGNTAMIVNGTTVTIGKIVYRYEIISLSSNDQRGIALVSEDPTVTLTVGSSTDNDNPVKVAVDIEFYDEQGNQFDLSEHNALVSLSSLNHWYGASYVNTTDNPRALIVEALDAEGNSVRGTYDPYADGSHMQNNGPDVVVKSGRADFGGADVTISESNPLKIVTQSYKWDDNKAVLDSESVTTEVTVNASGSGNFHSVGNEQYRFEGKDDILGSYTIDSTTGVIIYTPHLKFETAEHQESVNIGDKQYIAIPNSSVSYDPTTKEVTSIKDNQYTANGAVFNGENTGTATGWDNTDSPYLYYGSAGVVMTDGHLEFTAKGGNAEGKATVYWFAINSNINLPKNPSEEPEAPVPPSKPTPPTPPVYEEVPEVPGEPTPPTPPAYEEVPEVPGEPTPPTPPAYEEVPEVPGEPTPPTPPVYEEIPEVPGEPTPPTPPQYGEIPMVPKEPETPEAEWHKNVVITREFKPVPRIPEKPAEPGKPHEPKEGGTQEVASLPKTGEDDSATTAVTGLMVLLAGLGLASERRKKTR